MKTSSQGINLLIGREGEVLTAYKDSKGILTIGVGHTSAAGPPTVVKGMTITADQAREILTRDLAKFEKYVNDAVKVPINQYEFDALLSIMFNVGPQFKTSTAIMKLNRGDRKGAAEAIMMWNKPKEILSRRAAEQAQFRGTAFVARIH